MKNKILSPRINTAASILLFAGITAALLFCFSLAVSNLDDGKLQEDKQHLEEALRRTAVACYAIEGAYPDSPDYLIEKYGLQYNRQRFIIKYEFYGSNYMPDITVLYKK
jgi:hypothetical protein